MPVHNNADTIQIAVDSIIQQTHKNIEVLVIDDNSTDETRKIVKSMAQQDTRIQYYSLPENDSERFDPILKRNINAGYAARNFGFEQARGELLTFQDADDASLLNRIEVQYDLLSRHQATHITTNWLRFSEKLLGTKGNPQMNKSFSDPDKIYKLSQKTKGFVAKVSPSFNSLIPFHYKRLLIINKFFFGSLTPYPGAGNSPLFKREVIDKIKFRKLADRIWPSFMGRGADRDFNFQVAETFKNSYFFPIPLYLWHT
ncbi:MAG: glycosyltransferase family 2 protein [Patescibacteria group bacterium]